MSKAFQLDHEPSFVPVLNHDEHRRAAISYGIRKRLINMLETHDINNSLLVRKNQNELATALERFNADEIAEFIIVLVYQAGQELAALEDECDG